METKSKFDGLEVKFNDSSKTGLSDCSLCCLNCNSCEVCPLHINYYFVNPSHSLKESQGMSSDDKLKLASVLQDLKKITSILDHSFSSASVFATTISLAKSYLYVTLSDLDDIKTFDK